MRKGSVNKAKNTQIAGAARVVILRHAEISHFQNTFCHLCRGPVVLQAKAEYWVPTFQLPAARFCRAPAAPSRVSGLEHSDSSVR